MLGEYVQWAQAEDDTNRRGNDRLLAGEVSMTYRITERFVLFGALYGFVFNGEGGNASVIGAEGLFCPLARISPCDVEE